MERAPLPPPSPRSCLAGRGSRSLQRWWVYQDAPVHEAAGGRCDDWSVGLVNSHHPSRAGPPDCANICWWPDEWFGRVRRWNSRVAEWHVFPGESHPFHDGWPFQVGSALRDDLPHWCALNVERRLAAVAAAILAAVKGGILPPGMRTMDPEATGKARTIIRRGMPGSTAGPRRYAERIRCAAGSPDLPPLP